MKRMLLPAFMLACLLLMTLVVGCDEDEELIVTPGDLNDADFVAFSDEFEDMDEFNGFLLDLNFDLIDTLMKLPHDLSKPAIDFNLTYDSDSDYWICTIDSTGGEDGPSFSLVDSVQFRHASGAVQFPSEDSLTQIRCSMRVTANDTSATGGAFQMLTITKADPLVDSISITGTGGLDMAGSWIDINGTDTTSCTVDWDYDITYTNILLDTNEEGCPLSGTLGYVGALTLACTGASEVSVSGSWTVTQSFNGTTVTYVVTNGNTVWTATEDCR